MNISDIPTFIEQSNCQRVLAEIVRSRRLGIKFKHLKISLNLLQLQPRGGDDGEKEAARAAPGQSLLGPGKPETVQDSLALTWRDGLDSGRNQPTVSSHHHIKVGDANFTNIFLVVNFELFSNLL